MIRCLLFHATCAAGMVLSLGMMCFVSAADPSDPCPDEILVPLLETFVKEFVEITPGEGKFPKSFLMGDETGDPEEVTLKEQFSIAKYEMPQNLYQAVMGENPSKWKGKRNSVEMMTFNEAARFCTALTRNLWKHKLIDADEIIRLPTNAEWEYCCRAGTKTAYSFGNEATVKDDAGNKATLLDAYAWHTGNAAGNDPPVGAKKPNPWGLYDMHGYLWEFTADTWMVAYDQPFKDFGSGEGKGSTKGTIRGGSWKDRYPALRSASLKSIEHDTRDDAVGFRCVKQRRAKSP